MTKMNPLDITTKKQKLRKSSRGNKPKASLKLRGKGAVSTSAKRTQK
jgi:hypothetical protein